MCQVSRFCLNLILSSNFFIVFAPKVQEVWTLVFEHRSGSENWFLLLKTMVWGLCCMPSNYWFNLSCCFLLQDYWWQGDGCYGQQRRQNALLKYQARLDRIRAVVISACIKSTEGKTQLITGLHGLQSSYTTLTDVCRYSYRVTCHESKKCSSLQLKSCYPSKIVIKIASQWP